MIRKSERVQRICREESIGEDEFQYICRHAALVTEGSFNRRFHGWLLDIREGLCHNMKMIHLQTVGRATGNGWIEEEHEQCGGEGCHACGWAGQVVWHF